MGNYLSASSDVYPQSLAHSHWGRIEPESEKRQTGNAILKDILAEIRIQDEEKRKSMEIINCFVAKLIQVMKETDKFFRAFYVEPYYTGSSYEGLRIKHPDEYDIDLILRLPFGINNVQIVKDNSCFGRYKLKGNWKEALRNEMMRCNIATSNPNVDVLQFVANFIENDHVIPSKVRSWLQSVIARIDANAFRVPGVSRVLYTSSGPARTFLLSVGDYTDNGIEHISVDIVPVFKFSLEHINHPLDSRVLQKVYYHHEKFFFLVPKEAPNSALLWRIHFPDIEKKFIHDSGCVKPVIKLLKLLRDKWDRQSLSSYYLKTAVMWELLLTNSDWAEGKLYERLMQVMKSLEQYARRRHLQHILFPDCNLLENMSRDEGENIANSLRRMIRKIESDVSSLGPIFYG